MARSPFAYAFEPDEPVARGFGRVLEQMALEARRLPRRSRGDMAKSIHNGRILIKRLRALLWFARPALAPAAMAKARARLRRASRLLAAPRDQAVMRSTLGKLARKNTEPRDREALVRASRALTRRSR